MTLIVAILLVTRPAVAGKAPATASLRLGAQALPASHPFPAVGLYGTLPIGDRLSVGLGYELLRVFDGTLTTSTDTGAGPLIAGGLRAGIWRHGPREHGVFARAGVCLGVVSPLISPARLPSSMDPGSLVVEGTLDVMAGYAWPRVRVILFSAPTYSYGRFTSSGPGFSGHADVSAFSLTAGAGVMLTF